MSRNKGIIWRQKWRPGPNPQISKKAQPTLRALHPFGIIRLTKTLAVLITPTAVQANVSVTRRILYFLSLPSLDSLIFMLLCLHSVNKENDNLGKLDFNFQQLHLLLQFYSQMPITDVMNSNGNVQTRFLTRRNDKEDLVLQDGPMIQRTSNLQCARKCNLPTYRLKRKGRNHFFWIQKVASEWIPSRGTTVFWDQSPFGCPK